MSALHFLLRTPGKVRGAVHVNHGTGEFADRAQSLVERFCEENGVPLDIYHVDSGAAAPEKSLEEHWRDQRYLKLDEAFHNGARLPIVLAHTMDDCLEEYIMCTMVRGYSGTIPYKRGPCVRPFRLWKREEISDYATLNKVPSLEDPTNFDHARFMRAKIRKLVSPRIRYLNPGIYKIVERAIDLQDTRDGNRESS